ncbi:MAG: rhomboid family intramembrane serine protease [Pseudomonadota bacterium]
MQDYDIFAAPVTYGILVLNLIISGYAFFVDDRVVPRFALTVGPILRAREYDRLVMHGFLHVDPLHFLANMITLFFFGRFVEVAVLGSMGFLCLYMGALLIAAAVSVWVKRGNLLYSAIGASGAVSGVLFAFCLVAPFQEIYIFPIPFGIPAIIYAGLYIAYSSFAAAGGVRDRIAHEAHLGGALGGLALTIMLEPRALAVFLSNF